MSAVSLTGHDTDSAPVLSGAPALFLGALTSADISKTASFQSTLDASTV